MKKFLMIIVISMSLNQSLKNKISKTTPNHHYYENLRGDRRVKSTDLLDWSGEGLGGSGSTEKSSSLPCTASMLVLARVNGAVGLAMPIRTGTIRDSATLHSSSTA